MGTGIKRSRWARRPRSIEAFGPSTWDQQFSPDQVRCSLIVLNYNGLHLLTDCLDSLLVSAGSRDEIIVVDNGSTDGTVQAVRALYPQVRLVCLAENFFIFGLNAGVAQARGEFVAFLNNDMTVDADFVEESLAGFDAPDVFAVCPRILDGNGADQGSRTSGHWHRGLMYYRCLDHVAEPTDCFFAVGGQSFFRREQLVKLESIDPLLWPMYHEDIELSYRAWKAGWRVRYAPRAICHHLGSQTSKRVLTPSQLRSFVRQNEFLTVWKNVTDRRLLLEHLILILPRLVAATARRDWPTLIGFGRAVWRLPQVADRRREAQKRFVRSDREVLRLVATIAEASSPASSSTTATVRQKRLYDGLWRAGRNDALSPDLMRFQVWRPHLQRPVADIGAGDALLSRTYPSLDVLSVDLSSTGLRRGGSRVTAAAAEALPLIDGCMRTVVLSEVLEHAERPDLVLDECRRVLADDGRLLLSVPLWPLAHAENLYHWLRIRQRPQLANISLWDPNHERRYALDSLLADVRAAGFAVDQTTPLFGSASTAALYVFEPVVARLSGWRPRLAQRMTAADSLIRRLDHSSGVALVCSPINPLPSRRQDRG